MKNKREPGSVTAMVADEIRKLRQEAGLTISGMDGLLGWSRGRYSHLEYGEIRIPVFQLAEVAVALNVPLTRLLEPVIELVEELRDGD